VADSLLKHGRVLRAWIGIHGVDVADSGGAQVQDLIDKGPAAAAGLQPGDVIVHIDGLEIDRMSDLSIRLRAYEPGAVVNIGVLRDGMTEQFSVALTQRPDDAD
jgi:S1-C subfamily serine protease